MDGELSKKWDERSQKVPEGKTHSGYAESVEAMFPRHAHILDVGGGGGEDMAFFLNHGHSVHIVEISNHALARSRARAESLNASDRLVTSPVDLAEGILPISSSSADVVYSRLSVHYFPVDQTVKIMKELERVLANDGQAYLVVKSPTDEEEMAYLKSSAEEVEENLFRDEVGFKSRFSEQQWKEILEEAGIRDYTLSDYTENLTGKNDLTNSGNLTQHFLQIRFSKQQRTNQ